MIGNTVHKGKQNHTLPFLVRFAQKPPSDKLATGDIDQKHSTIITEVRRETTDDR